MEIRWLSHACFEIKSAKTILIDPFFKGNKLAPKYDGKPDMILITHEHFDHSNASGFDSKIVSPPNLDYENSIKMRIGETKEVDGVKLTMVESSHHQSKYPTGFIIELEGKRLYHAGDTYLDGVKDRGSIDVFFVPIGGFYTMNVDEAVEALKIVRPNLAIPMHFNTLDKIKTNPDEFKEKAERLGFKVRVMKIGETIKI